MISPGRDRVLRRNQNRSDNGRFALHIAVDGGAECGFERGRPRTDNRSTRSRCSLPGVPIRGAGRASTQVRSTAKLNRREASLPQGLVARKLMPTVPNLLALDACGAAVENLGLPGNFKLGETGGDDRRLEL